MGFFPAFQDIRASKVSGFAVQPKRNSLMKVTKRDLFAVAAVLFVLVVLIMSTARDKAKRVPVDDKHRASYEAMEKGLDRIRVERGCITCHNSQTIPLPEKHPPKEQCLICHKLNKPKK